MNNTLNFAYIVLISRSYLWNTAEALLWSRLNRWHGGGVLAITLNDIKFALEGNTFTLSHNHIIAVAKFQI